MDTKKYHPEYDLPDKYIQAAKQEVDIDKKRLFEQAAATIAYLKKHHQGTRKLLAEINNEIVEISEEDPLFFSCTHLESFFSRINAAMESSDDSEHEFSTPFYQWSHLI